MMKQSKYFCQSVTETGGERKREKQQRLLQSFLRYAQTQKTYEDYE